MSEQQFQDSNQAKPERLLLMVLNDGETYTWLKGCKILSVTPTTDQLARLEDHESTGSGLIFEGELWDDDDEIIAQIYNEGQTEHGKVIAEFGESDVMVKESASAILSFFQQTGE